MSTEFRLKNLSVLFDSPNFHLHWLVQYRCSKCLVPAIKSMKEGEKHMKSWMRNIFYAYRNFCHQWWVHFGLNCPENAYPAKYLKSCYLWQDHINNVCAWITCSWTVSPVYFLHICFPSTADRAGLPRNTYMSSLQRWKEENQKISNIVFNSSVDMGVEKC